TLASIIEKEAVERREMPLISAVFWNRLKLEMPLQADPTVQYAVGKDPQRLTRHDLLTESAFNTYLRGRPPPGPMRRAPPCARTRSPIPIVGRPRVPPLSPAPASPRSRPQRPPPPSTISTSSPR